MFPGIVRVAAPMTRRSIWGSNKMKLMQTGRIFWQISPLLIFMFLPGAGLWVLERPGGDTAGATLARTGTRIGGKIAESEYF